MFEFELIVLNRLEIVFLISHYRFLRRFRVRRIRFVEFESGRGDVDIFDDS